MKIMIRTLFLLLILFSLPTPQASQTDALKTLVDIKTPSENNKIEYASKEEVESLRSELSHIKELLHNLEKSTGEIDNKIEGEIKKETASHIVTIYSGLVRNSLMVLGFFIALLSVAVSLLVGFIGIPKLHSYMKRLISKTHKKYEEESEYRIFYKVYMQLSHAFYLYYRSFFTKPEHPAFRSGNSLAIWFSDGAIKSAEKLPKGEREDSITHSKLHRAYHYASSSVGLEISDFDRQAALEIAKESRSFIDKLDIKSDRWMFCNDTVAWIYILLGDINEKKEGNRILDKLIKSEFMTPNILKEIINNYNDLKSTLEGDPYFPIFIDTNSGVSIKKEDSINK